MVRGAAGRCGAVFGVRRLAGGGGGGGGAGETDSSKDRKLSGNSLYSFNQRKKKGADRLLGWGVEPNHFTCRFTVVVVVATATATAAANFGVTPHEMQEQHIAA